MNAVQQVTHALPLMTATMFLAHMDAQVIDHFTVVCSVTWPCIGSEAGGDLVLIQTSLLFIRKCKLVSIRTA